MPEYNDIYYQQMMEIKLNNSHSEGLESTLRFHEELLVRSKLQLKMFSRLAETERGRTQNEEDKEDNKKKFIKYLTYFATAEAVKTLLEAGSVSKKEFVQRVVDTVNGQWREIYKDTSEGFMPEAEMQKIAEDAFRSAAYINDGGKIAYAY